MILSKHDHIVPLENVCWYFQKRAQGIYDRAYGNVTDSEIKPEKPISNVVRNDAQIEMLDYCTTKVQDSAPPRTSSKLTSASPRPPAPVYRGRDVSIDESDKRMFTFTNDDENTNSAPPACWFEWTVFDCAHGEQMMVPKFLQIILDKVQERSEYLK